MDSSSLLKNLHLAQTPAHNTTQMVMEIHRTTCSKSKTLAVSVSPAGQAIQ